jgi:hypothetical protein
VFGGLRHAGAGIEEGAGVGAGVDCAEAAAAGIQSTRSDAQTRRITRRRTAPIVELMMKKASIARAFLPWGDVVPSLGCFLPRRHAIAAHRLRICRGKQRSESLENWTGVRLSEAGFFVGLPTFSFGLCALQRGVTRLRREQVAGSPGTATICAPQSILARKVVFTREP